MLPGRRPEREVLTRALVVEDEARIRLFLARAFEAEGFTVDVVSNGERGLVLGTSGGYEIPVNPSTPYFRAATGSTCSA